MPLIEITSDIAPGPVPEAVRELIAEGEERIDDYLRAPSVRRRGFVASDFPAVYSALERVWEHELAPGTRFLEWGSGFGVVAGMAALLGFDAHGIEIQPDLVAEAERLTGDLQLDVCFVTGSFVPRGCEDLIDAVTEYPWHDVAAGDGYEDLGLDLDDFDVVFAYPWPGEEHLVEEIFERRAAEGAILITQHSGGGVALQRASFAGTVVDDGRRSSRGPDDVDGVRRSSDAE